MKIYVDIDNTICTQELEDYGQAKPWLENILKVNKLYDKGHEITYYTARGSVTGIDWYDTTKKQLDEWGCKYDKLSVGEKPFYDLLICDRTMRIEEIMVEDEIFE